MQPRCRRGCRPGGRLTVLADVAAPAAATGRGTGELDAVVPAAQVGTKKAALRGRGVDAATWENTARRESSKACVFTSMLEECGGVVMSCLG